MRSPQIGSETSELVRFSILRIGLPVLLLAAAFSAFAVEPGTAQGAPDWVQLFLGLFGGLALFLGGLQLLSEGG